MCSDGVVDGLWDRGIEDIALGSDATGPAGSPAERLVLRAVEESGRDNATAVIVEAI
ncbi:MAG: hypothetical protein R3C56_22245 [Pirellulaceae bacterium]